MTVDQLELVVITGMSGAGKTVAMQSFEDMGYFCVDNMPPSLLPKFWELVKESGKITKIALVIDLRSRAFFDEIMTSISGLDNTSFITTKILFLEASDDALVSRYKETRRTHPLAGDGRVYDGIIAERRLLQDIKVRAQKVIDTTTLSPRKLREEIMHTFSNGDTDIFTIQVVSFGFKYGIPLDADYVFDVRFLPNPHWNPELRPMTGLDEPVAQFLLAHDEVNNFIYQTRNYIETWLPMLEQNNRSYLTISIGCTGGKHRSVYIAQQIGEYFQAKGKNVKIQHKSLEKNKKN